MRVLVTGGRMWLDKQRTWNFLDLINNEVGITLLIHGDAVGADSLCRDWAYDRGVEDMPFPISSYEWNRYGDSAGPKRNQHMIDSGNPDVVVSFPGQNGTRDMKSRATKCGLDVWDMMELEQ